LNTILSFTRKRFEALAGRRERRRSEGHDLEEIIEGWTAVGWQSTLGHFATTLKGAGISFIQDNEG